MIGGRRNERGSAWHPAPIQEEQQRDERAAGQEDLDDDVGTDALPPPAQRPPCWNPSFHSRLPDDCRPPEPGAFPG